MRKYSSLVIKNTHIPQIVYFLSVVIYSQALLKTNHINKYMYVLYPYAHWNLG